MSTTLHMKRSEKCTKHPPRFEGSKNSPSVRRIQTSPSMSSNTLQRRLTLLGTLVLKLYANAIQSPVHYYQLIKKNYCRHRGLNPRRTFCAIIFQLLFHTSYWYLSDDRVRLRFCDSTVNMPYANQSICPIYQRSTESSSAENTKVQTFSKRCIELCIPYQC